MTSSLQPVSMIKYSKSITMTSCSTPTTMTSTSNVVTTATPSDTVTRTSSSKAGHRPTRSLSKVGRMRPPCPGGRIPSPSDADYTRSKVPPKDVSKSSAEITKSGCKIKPRTPATSLKGKEVAMNHVTRQSPEPMQDDVYYKRMREVLLAEPCRGYPSEPSRLLDHVYIGNQTNAENLRLLRRLGITHVLNCAGYKGPRPKTSDSPYVGLGISYHEFKAEDNESYDITKHFYEAFQFLDKTESQGGVALVHCAMGVNRSAAVCMAYMMVRNTLSLLRATKVLKEKRRVVLANRGFQRQLVRFARKRGLLDRHVIPDGRESPVRRSSVDYSGQRRPSLDGILSQRRPSIEYSSPRKASVEYISQRRPSIEYISQRRPSTDYTSQRRPSTDYTGSQIRPSTDYISQRRPSTDYTSQRRPSTDYTSQRRPSVEYSQPRRASVDYSHATSVRSHDPDSSRPAIRYRSSSLSRPTVTGVGSVTFRVREPLLHLDRTSATDRMSPRLLPLPPSCRRSVPRERTY